MYKEYSRISDVNPGEDLIEVLGGEVVEAAAVGEELVELVYGQLAASSRDVCRWGRRLVVVMLLLRGAQVFFHGSLFVPFSNWFQITATAWLVSPLLVSNSISFIFAR